MKFGVKHQDSYSRGQLLLRAFFGWLYILIPHVIVLYILSIVSAIFSFVAFWSILFTAKYPQGMYDFQLNLQRWGLRLQARMLNLSDGYPAFGLTNTDPNIVIELERQETYSRGLLLLRFFFGIFYVLIPHVFVLFFLLMGANIINFITFWAILFTGKNPKTFHDYLTGVLRWAFRVNAYMSLLTDKYPPFSLSQDAATFDEDDNKTDISVEETIIRNE